MRPLIPRPLGAPDPARLARVRTLFDDDATADGVLRWLVRFQRRPAAQVVTLVDDDLQWRFLDRIWRLEPALMWLADRDEAERDPAAHVRIAQPADRPGSSLITGSVVGRRSGSPVRDAPGGWCGT